MMERSTPPPLDVPVLEDGEQVSRVDLVFYGVDHSGPSYEAHVFIDQPDADLDTPLDQEHGYAGSFTVFGHDGCYGDEGHCLPDQRYTDEFDQRPPHPLQPWTKTVIAGDALVRAVEDPEVSQVSLTVVADVLTDESSSAKPAASYDSVRLLVYAD